MIDLLFLAATRKARLSQGILSSLDALSVATQQLGSGYAELPATSTVDAAPLAESLVEPTPINKPYKCALLCQTSRCRFVCNFEAPQM